MFYFPGKPGKPGNKNWKPRSDRRFQAKKISPEIEIKLQNLGNFRGKKLRILRAFPGAFPGNFPGKKTGESF